MADKNTPRNTRGPYRKYLKDPSIKVPSSTLLSRRKRRRLEQVQLYL